MSWRESLRAASFRGVDFGVETMTRSGGRRGTSHEFPNRDKPFFEDTGRKTREFTFDGFIVGEDYLVKRDRLIFALETEGSGPLIHPTYGVVDVVCLSFSVEESKDGLGMAKFTISFLEVGDLAQPEAKESVKSQLADAIVAVRLATVADFSQTFNVVGYPNYVADEALSVLDNSVGQLQNVTNGVRSQTQNVATLKAKFIKIKDDLNTIVNFPETLANEIDQLHLAMASLFEDPKSIARGLISRAQKNPGPVKAPTITTPTLDRIRDNETAINDFDKRQAVVTTAESLIDAEFDSLDEAEQFRKDLTDQISEVLDRVGVDYSVYESFYALRKEVIRSIPQDSSTLPKRFNFKLQESTPSLLVTYNLFGNLDKESDIISLNEIKNPLFLEGGEDYEAIGDGGS